MSHFKSVYFNICKTENLNLILFIFSSPFYPFLCRIRQMMFARHLLFMKRQHRGKGGIETFDFRIFLDKAEDESSICLVSHLLSSLTIQGPALKACKLIFFCENNKNVLRGILTDLWLIPALTQRMIGWLEKHNSNSELLSNYFRLSPTFCTFPRYNQQIISNVLQGKKHVRGLNHSLNTQLTRTFCGENWKKFKIYFCGPGSS